MKHPLSNLGIQEGHSIKKECVTHTTVIDSVRLIRCKAICTRGIPP